ncbi:MAG: bifunctional UDP-N-acetylglucosamine diphosphorylase/glucosamine-1-phosphate N-acetyltransferase GlmU [Actinobacteria bacterium]|nr:bifunctional UDP-N-acetylglucosamine diphosphorylase/glucosamine-1-phosphate N-acetyltransferase GlmU [Actinomycetota bacterium]
MDFSKDLSVVILAAGKGKRMKSEMPKVLHKVCGRPMIYYILKQIIGLDPKNIFIAAGHKKELLKDYLDREFASVRIVVQDRQLGTGHAVKMVRDKAGDFGKIMLVLGGDSPLVSGETLRSLISLRDGENAAAVILTSVAADSPGGYGRIVKNKKGEVMRIVEEADASPSEKEIDEVNSSIYCFDTELLFKNIDSIDEKNSQGEYYLTDIIEILIKKGHKIKTFIVDDHNEVKGINDRIQLSETEKIIRRSINKRLMESGVTMVDPDTVYIEDTVQVGSDTIIEPSCFLKGRTVIGKNCTIGPFSQLTDTIVGRESIINSSVINGAEIGAENNIGPYSYIRPGTKTGQRVKIGAFCEVKKSLIGDSSKVPHLSYIGDTGIGKGVNIGASSVTVNYNGFSKSRTIIEDDVFIGSDTMLIAPVRIGRGAIVAAGSVITKDVGENVMAIERAKQKNIKNGAVKYRNRKNKGQEK